MKLAVGRKAVCCIRFWVDLHRWSLVIMEWTADSIISVSGKIVKS
nr:hypothetical protein [Portibacter lacus]